MATRDTAPDWQPPVYVITGEQGGGKTTFLQEVISGLKTRGVRCRGIVAPGYFKDNIRSGFSVTDVATGTSEPLCSDIPSPDCELHGRFYFRKEGLAFGYRALAGPLPEETDLLVIDEVGRFELKGEIWAGCINRLFTGSRLPMLWTVRCDKVDEVLKRWPPGRLVIVELGSSTSDAVVRDLMEEIRAYRSVPGQQIRDL